MTNVYGHNRTRSLASLVSRQPATTSAESQLVPICGSEVKAALGAWKSVHILIDHVALEAGFSKQAFQAQCVTMEDAGEAWKFVHVKKNAPWFIAAVGGPQLKKGNMPSVHVVDVLYSKVFGKQYKNTTHEDEDRSRGEDDDNEEVVKDDEVAEDDPMLMLAECAPDLVLETPKKKV